MSEKPRPSRLSSEEIYRRMTPEDLNNSMQLIEYLAVEGGITYDEAAVLMERAQALVDPLKEKSQTLAKQRIDRRNFLKGLATTTVSLTVLGGTGWGLVEVASSLFGETARRRATEKYIAQQAADKEFRRRLETSNTLGLEPSTQSFSGWHVRYAKNDGTFYAETNRRSTPIDHNTAILLPGDRLNELDDTGILIREHLRTSDDVPVGRLAIATKFTPEHTVKDEYGNDKIIPNQYSVTEEVVLKNQPDDVLVFEKPTSEQRYHLRINRSKSKDNQPPVFSYHLLTPKTN